jgi:hypothetical protein
MFNSKKIKQLIQQQELLDAKINSLAHGQKSLSEDFEVHFKRLRQSIYTSVEEFSSELQSEMRELKKENEAIKNLIINVGDKPMRLGKIESNQKHQTILFATKIQLLTDQIEDLKNQIAKPKTHGTSQLLDTQIGFKDVLNPNLTMPNGTNSSPIQDKMKLEVSEIFNDSSQSENIDRKRKTRKAMEDRNVFFINTKLPEGVFNYLHNRSSSKSISVTCRNVFEREGKLVFAPLSTEITKNFVGKKNKIVTIQVAKNTYVAMSKIASDLEMTITQVASNFVATMDSVEATQIGLKYSTFNSKELQTKAPIEKKSVGRPKKLTKTK